MKLSDAILLGSIGTKQAFGTIIDSSGKTCAFGAAFTAVGALTDGINGLEILESQGWKWVSETRADCPCGCLIRDQYKIMHIITHLNDEMEWPRPKIAEWVASVEPQETVVIINEPITEAERVTR